MCGITGFVDFNSKTKIETLNSMVFSMNHRGPDDFGGEIFEMPNCSVGLGQARLAIIDLSSGGHQPMHFEGFSIVFNGEIYNFKEIKENLITLGHKFISASDTEVILHAFKEWGIYAVNSFIGMFAFVILDKVKNEIIIVRDRAGIKPLYYYWKDDLFLFGSELKTFYVNGDFKKDINLKSIPVYFDYGYIPAPATIFNNCFKLEPGKWIKFNLTTKEIELATYWDVNNFYRKEKLDINYEEAKTELKKILISSCNYRMISDVPVGVFLSGGYDSTLVTALLQANNSDRIRTYTIGFEEGNNEAPYAKKTASFLGTNHTEYYCTKKEAQEIIPNLPYFFDEPFADSSAIPTILVSELAKKDVKVALSADAGDEIFCGYNSYSSLSKKLAYLNYVPSSLKPISSSMLKYGMQLIPDKKINLRHKIKGISDSLNSNLLTQSSGLFRNMNILPEYFHENLMVNEQETGLDGYLFNPNGFKNEIEVAMAGDYKMYLQNDILTKVDRATMSVSLEGREPLLDHRIVEFAATLPLNYKFDGKTSKKILKDIVHQYVPKSMMDRPKSGFSLPIYSWLRNDLNYLIRENLDEKSIEKMGIFNLPFIRKQIQFFNENQLHYTPFIWKLLMFQLWYSKWMD